MFYVVVAQERQGIYIFQFEVDKFTTQKARKKRVLHACRVGTLYWRHDTRETTSQQLSYEKNVSTDGYVPFYVHQRMIFHRCYTEIISLHELDHVYSWRKPK